MDILAIGTAQFGLDYGIKNAHKKLSQTTVRDILNVALDNKITTIDTAQGYGESEVVLGNYFLNNPRSDYKIITKIDKTTNVVQLMNDSFTRLNQDKLYGVLVHNFEFYKNNPIIFEKLREIKQTKRIEKIGFSLYYPEDLELLLDSKTNFDIIQIAYSIFDRRFEKYFPILIERNVEIHIRSVFLQGLFFLDPVKLVPHFDKVKDKLKSLHNLSVTTGLSISSLCLNFVANNPCIAKIVIGIDTPEDLLNNIKVLNENKEVRKYFNILNQYSVSDLDILFPHFWKLN
jgi:uncharacterized protein